MKVFICFHSLKKACPSLSSFFLYRMVRFDHRKRKRDKITTVVRETTFDLYCLWTTVVWRVAQKASSPKFPLFFAFADLFLGDSRVSKQ